MTDRSEIFGTAHCAAKCGAEWEKVCRVCLGALCAAHHPAGMHSCKPADDRSGFYPPEGAPEPAGARSVDASDIERVLGRAMGILKAGSPEEALSQFEGAMSALSALGLLTEGERGRWSLELGQLRRPPGRNGTSPGEARP